MALIITKEQPCYTPMAAGPTLQKLRARLEEEWGLIAEGTAFYELRPEPVRKTPARAAKKKTLTKIKVFELTYGNRRMTELRFVVHDSAYEERIRRLRLE